MRESEDAAKKWGVVAFAREGPLVCSPAAGEDEAGGQGIDFEVLEVVVVCGEVEVHLVLSQERTKGGDEVTMVSVHPVGKNGVVSDDAGECSAGGGKLLFEPFPLLCFFGVVQMRPRGFLIGKSESGAIDGARVGIDEEKGRELSQIFPVPF